MEQLTILNSKLQKLNDAKVIAEKLRQKIQYYPYEEDTEHVYQFCSDYCDEQQVRDVISSLHNETTLTPYTNEEKIDMCFNLLLYFLEQEEEHVGKEIKKNYYDTSN